MQAPALTVGEIDIWAVSDGMFTFAEPAGFPAKDSPEFAPHADYITPDGLWRMDIGAFAVRTGDRLLLLDAGAGPSDGAVYMPPAFTGIDDVDPSVLRYMRDKGLDDEQITLSLHQLSRNDVRHGDLGRSLEAAGFAPEDFTDVVLSHLHHDHIGWVSRDGKPYFPNARVWCERHDADYFLDPSHDDSFYRWMSNAIPTAERMAPVLDRLETWDEDATVAPGVDMRFAPGHTPGSCIAIVSSGPERALVLGDTVHCPLEIMEPDFTILADMDQALGDRTRDMIRREMDSGTTHASAPHFSGLRFGRIVPGEGKRGWSFDATFKA